ncbi:dynamin family protein [Bacillus sp. FJAT-29814]|uniref:dynamin family protein n=1 Tax=Bacillus sp. FJAT-29814 TaxID=1729688 RepID=UPI000833FC3D|nr:dynamin family protein [Bacillus sp. FJAT-29814]
MVKTANRQETIETLKQKIVSLYDYFIGHEDEQNAAKLKQLAKKLENREFAIAFCGHFSAGKSTMINQVIGEKLLPSSPIPTSANLVKVKSGEDYAKVFFKNDKPRLYLAPYDYELVKNYCKDGDKIEEIEISHSDSHLPQNTVIMDTPGIDSADDAHRIATESAIHLADLIFYVMDYNHVQAELNFLFTKELTQAGKDVYLVINQIDKHKEEELRFQDFQNSVTESFASWGVKPAGIFYTSLRHEDHRYNQFGELKRFIADKLAAKDQLIIPSVFHSLKKLAHNHLDQVEKLEAERLLPSETILDELSDEEKSELLDSYTRITNKLQILRAGTEEQEKSFDFEIAQLLKNAYLMPFGTRELAERYLESCQPGFKVGFLFSKQKTEEERNARLESFHQDILEKTKSQLEWHIREFLLRTLKERELDVGELLLAAQSYSIPVSKDGLTKVVKSGALLSGEYLLHYTDDVANEIKRIARNSLAEIKAMYVAAIKEQATKQSERYEEEYRKLGRYVTALAELQKYKEAIAKNQQVIEELLNHEGGLADVNNPLFIAGEEEFDVIKSHLVPDTNTDISTNINKRTVNKVNAVPAYLHAEHEDDHSKGAVGHLKQTVDRLRHASGLVKGLPGFQKLGLELVEKAERLENKGFTVALFGAFSAGKSSFANALIGEKVLPVSPNPTTAAINKIKPVTKEYQHGTVLVKFKEKQAMLDDLNRSLKVFDSHANDFVEAAKQIDKIMLEQGQEGVLEKTHYAFLQAFNQGCGRFANQLGTVKSTDLKEFHEFVAHEEKSCFVEWIELYYDCELTKKGITLVDTPGADSINARHTGVAFDYIKNSDAILFVTYYNHAFSKADREFLIQLGRVKESFQMDKMFFIINAIDLAEDEEEKHSVLDYVSGQLIQYGIRNPHLYPLSSLLGLQEKTNNFNGHESGLPRFEQAFYRFIANDLTEMAIAAAESELERVRLLVKKLIQNSQEDKSVKEQKRLELETQKGLIQALFANQTVEPLKTRLFQEADELIYYIKQRVFLRFNDFFKEAFNPSTLRDDGRNLKKALQAALDEFLESLGFDFAQEMRATTVRIDRFIDKLLTDYQAALIRSLNEINQDLSFSNFERGAGGEIDFPLAFVELEQQLFTKAKSYFKNPKAFFEKNEKQLMNEELYRVLTTPADDYLKLEGERLKRHYDEQLSKDFDLLVEHMKAEGDDFYFSLLAALEGGVSLDMLLEVSRQLEN